MSLDLVFSDGLAQKQQRRIGSVTLQKLERGEKGLEHHIQAEAQQLVETLARAKGMWCSAAGVFSGRQKYLRIIFVLALEKNLMHYLFPNRNTNCRWFPIRSLAPVRNPNSNRRVWIDTFLLTASFAGQHLDPLLPITNSVCNGISAAVFGHRFPAEDEEFRNLTEAIGVALKYGGSFVYAVSRLLLASESDSSLKGPTPSPIYGELLWWKLKCWTKPGVSKHFGQRAASNIWPGVLGKINK